MALTAEQLDEVRRELAARMGNDTTYKNPRTEGAGFMGFGTKTDPLLGNPSPSDNIDAQAGAELPNTPEVQDAGAAARQGYQQTSGGKKGSSQDLSNALKMFQNNGQDFAPSAAAATPGTNLMDFNAPFGSTGSSMVDAGAASGDIGSTFGNNPDIVSGGNGNLMDFSQGFGSGEGGAASAGGGSWASAAGGALSGALAGHQNYQNDPKMQSKEDGFGGYHRDYRAELGGGTLGGVMGYFGGPVGAAFAGPTVKAVHPGMERLTRNLVREGDNVGGSGGALMLDPVGTIASGKYSWGDLGKGALFGPAKKWFNF